MDERAAANEAEHNAFWPHSHTTVEANGNLLIRLAVEFLSDQRQGMELAV